MLEAKTPPPEMTPPGIGITWIKHFWSKRLTIGPGEKIISSIERSKSGGEAVGVHFLVFLFSVYLSMYILSIY